MKVKNKFVRWLLIFISIVVLATYFFLKPPMEELIRKDVGISCEATLDCYQ